jgi:hypothetical protein
MHRTSSSKPGYILPTLAVKPFSQWNWAEKQFVFCMFWITQVGWRGEEFNGRQLTSATLLSQLLQKRREYVTLLAGASTPPTSYLIADLAEQIAGLRLKVQRSHTCTRWIHGLTFYKEERWLVKKQVLETMGLPADLRSFTERVYGVRLRMRNNIEPYLRNVAAVAMNINNVQQGTSSVSGIEALIMHIVDSALQQTDSDMAMSRGVRDIGMWLRAWDKHSFIDICNWPISFYYCYVTTSRNYSLRLTPPELTKAVIAVAKRMQFNSWHYAPSHIPRNIVPHDRHFFLAPSMADRTEWSDQRHGGHKLVGARHSLRLPFPLAYRSHSFSGMGDLRLMRQCGAAYSESELRTASVYSECLRIICQSVCDRVAQGEHHRPIQAFTEEWYKTYTMHLGESHYKSEYASDYEGG